MRVTIALSGASIGRTITALDSTRYFKLASVVTYFKASINGTLRKESVILRPSTSPAVPAPGAAPGSAAAPGAAGGVGGGVAGLVGPAMPPPKTIFTPTLSGSRRRL